MDFQMKTLSVGSSTITLQLWDTAGQERSAPPRRAAHAPARFSCFLSFLDFYVLATHSEVLWLFRFCSITEQYYRKADGILAMYDLTRSASFSALGGWMRSVKVSR